jgi:hypothetical protein
MGSHACFAEEGYLTAVKLEDVMKMITAVAIAIATISTTAIAADPQGPADKTDSGSLSSGAKQAAPATKDQGENAPVGSSSSGTSTGESGATSKPQLKKPQSSDPAPAK